MRACATPTRPSTPCAPCRAGRGRSPRSAPATASTSWAAPSATCSSAAARGRSISSWRATSRRRSPASAGRRSDARPLRHRRASRSATARSTSPARARERYLRPGALPEVEPASLEEDLRRRDVTVNAMASASTGHAAHRPRSGRGPRGGVLRVLHDRSFADDPTRLWRVARYAARLGFAVEPRTRALPTRPTRRRSAATASGPSCGSRCASRGPPAALRAARDSSRRLLPGFELSTRAAGPGRRARAACPRTRAAPMPWRLAAATAGMDARALLRWLDEMGFTAPDRDMVAARRRAPRPARRCARPHTGAEIARAARAPRSRPSRSRAARTRGAGSTTCATCARDHGDDLLAAGVPQGPESASASPRAGRSSTAKSPVARRSSPPRSADGRSARCRDANALRWDGGPGHYEV